jgi:hypothetical protein
MFQVISGAYYDDWKSKRGSDISGIEVENYVSVVTRDLCSDISSNFCPIPLLTALVFCINVLSLSTHV